MIPPVLLFSLLTFVVTFPVANAQLEECQDAFSCTDDTINTDAICHGLFSCARSRISFDDEVLCDASYSCYQSRLLSDSSSSLIDCTGLYSCASCPNITSATIQCSGEFSCANSTITRYHAEDATLYCNGARSCENTVIYTNGPIRADGYLSMQNSTIYAYDSSISIELRGIFAGKDATIVCRRGHTCTIYCESSNACNDLTFYCEGNENYTCNIITYCNEESEDSAACNRVTQTDIVLPAIEGSDIMVTQFVEESVIWSDYNNSYLECVDSSSVDCGGYKSCADDNPDGYDRLLTSEHNGNICCGGVESCYARDNITTINGGTIRCDGKLGCEWASSEVKTRLVGVDFNVSQRNYIYLTGYEAGQRMRTGFFGGNKDYYYSNIMCSGELSCNQSPMRYFANIYCLGYQSCFQNGVSNNLGVEYVGNVWYYGSYAGYDALGTYHVNGSVYCGGYNACAYAKIGYVYGDTGIVAKGKQVLYDTVITNVDNGLYAVGVRALRMATVANVTKVSNPLPTSLF